MRWFGSGTTVDRIRINDDQEWKVVEKRRTAYRILYFVRSNIPHTHLDKFYDSRVVIVRLDEAKINTRTFPFRLRFYSTLQLRQTASPVSRKRVSEREREEEENGKHIEGARFEKYRGKLKNRGRRCEAKSDNSVGFERSEFSGRLASLRKLLQFSSYIYRTRPDRSELGARSSGNNAANRV